MAWTTPRTWVTAEVVTAAIMNTHVRDNLSDLDSRVDVAGLRQVSLDSVAAQQSISSTTWTDTGLSISFTPEVATSTIVLWASIAGMSRGGSAAAIGLRLRRDSTDLVTFVNDGDLAQSVSSTSVVWTESSPGTSAVTYKVQFQRTSGSSAVSIQTGNEWTSTLLVAEFS